MTDDVNSLFRSEESRLVVLYNSATGEPLVGQDGKEMGIHVTSITSPKPKAVMKEVRAQTAKLRRGQTLSESKQEKYGLDLLVAATVGLQSIVMDGEVLEYSDKNVRKLYKKSDVIRDLINDEVGATELFTKGAMQQDGQ